MQSTRGTVGTAEQTGGDSREVAMSFRGVQFGRTDCSPPRGHFVFLHEAGETGRAAHRSWSTFSARQFVRAAGPHGGDRVDNPSRFRHSVAAVCVAYSETEVQALEHNLARPVAALCACQPTATTTEARHS